MYAQCPHCRTVFAVSPAQLATAGGRVRCGHCYKPFDGRSHLVDEASDRVVDELSEAAEAIDPARVLREQATLADEQPPPTIDEDRFHSQPSFHPAERRIDSEPVKPERAAVASAGPSTPASSGAPPAGVVPPPAEAKDVDVPELLQEDLSHLAPAADSTWPIRLAQLTVVLLLLVLLVGQYAWFMPKELLARIPVAQSSLAWLYERFDRDLPMPRDMSRIQLISRDVRVHPEYGNVLLVNAQLVNKAPYPQPFPTLRLMLFGVNGQVIAARGFSPQEYLSPELKRSPVMRPDVRVQIGMELVAPGTTAVSYEFQFL